MSGERPSGSEFGRWAGAIVDDLLRLRPEWACWLGDHRHDDRIDDRSAAGRAGERTVLADRRAEFAELDRDRLDPEDRVDAALIAGELDRRIFEIDELREVEWNPLVYNPGEALYPLVTRDVLALPDRVRAITARLELLPDLVLTARRQLDRPPRVHVETALARQPGTRSLLGDEISRLVAVDPGLRRIVEPAQRRALDALADHEVDLRRLLDGPHRSPRLGPARFERALQLTVGAPVSAAELAGRAAAHIEEVTEQLEQAALDFLGGRAGAPVGDRSATIRAALDRVAEHHPDDATVTARARAVLADATDAVRRLGLVTIPDDPVRIEVMPPFRRGVAVAYCDPAGPLEEGGTTSFAISPTPAGWSSDQILSFYREYNDAMLVNLAVHEAMPGHVVQLAHARRFRGSSPVRQVFWNGPFVEGWAVHAERIMVEHGHGGPAVRLQQLKMALRMAINTLLDVGVHAGELTEPEAMELMTRRGFQEEGEAALKWRRAQLSAAQLSTYFAGYSELAGLFARLGTVSCYDQVLAHGSPPPALLGELLGVPAAAG